jgi:hypothetical protein
LNLSRPTLYKYLEEYEEKKYKDIDKKTRKVFDFIKKRTTVSKIAVIDFIVNQLEDNTPSEIKKLFAAINKDEDLIDILLNEIHDVGTKGVITNIKLLYKKEIEK